jgi:small subunit ribosomal protein S1
MNTKPIKIFISYSHENDIWLIQYLDIKKHKPNPKYLLDFWERSFRGKSVEFWYDRIEKQGIHGGDHWRNRIFEEIDNADIAILLITQDFIISEFIREVELPRILNRSKEGKLELLPILLEPARLRDLDIDNTFQIVPGRPTPLCEYLESENEWKKVRLEVIESIENVIEKVIRKRNLIEPAQLPKTELIKVDSNIVNPPLVQNPPEESIPPPPKPAKETITKSKSVTHSLEVIENQLKKSWEKLKIALKKQEIIQGYVKSCTKGGFLVDVFDIEAFLPESQIEINSTSDYDNYVDSVLDFMVLEINQEDNKVVISNSVIVEHQLRIQKDDFLLNLEKGQIINGTIIGITSKEVIVNLDLVEGIIHISELSWGRFNHPEEIVEINQKIKVVIIDIDYKKERIVLSLKQLTRNPWDDLDQKLKIGDKIKGKVIKVTDIDAFIQTSAGVEGLIKVSEISWLLESHTAHDFLKVGDEVEAIILTLDRNVRQMSLGLKQLTPEPWESVKLRYPVGSQHKATIYNYNNLGILTEIGECEVGFIHFYNKSLFKRVIQLSNNFKINDIIDVIVIGFDDTNCRIILENQLFEKNAWIIFETIFTVNSVHNGTILNSSKNGVEVKLPFGALGFAILSELRKIDGSIAKLNETLDFKVIEFSKKYKKIILSHSKAIKEIRITESAKENISTNDAQSDKNKILKKINDNFEKPTLGDFEVLQKLKLDIEQKAHEKTEIYKISTQELGEKNQGESKNIETIYPKVGRNQPCPCGSGIKYKKCHELELYPENNLPQKLLQEITKENRKDDINKLKEEKKIGALQEPTSVKSQQSELVKPTITHPNVGRNDDCPCGSGRKYKFCHGSIGGSNKYPKVFVEQPPNVTSLEIEKQKKTQQPAELKDANQNLELYLKQQKEKADIELKSRQQAELESANRKAELLLIQQRERAALEQKARFQADEAKRKDELFAQQQKENTEKELKAHQQSEAAKQREELIAKQLKEKIDKEIKVRMLVNTLSENLFAKNIPVQNGKMNPVNEFIQSGQYDKALQILMTQEAELRNRKYNPNEIQANFNDQALVLTKMRRYKDALEKHEIQNDICARNNLFEAQANGLLNHAQLLIRYLNKPKQAINLLNEAILIAEECNFHDIILKAKTMLKGI